MPDQLPLFDSPPPVPTSRSGRSQDLPAAEDVRALEERFAALRPLADALPSSIRMGTSSWSFPGWKGIVYTKGGTASRLAQEGLREYARHPLLTTVGVDRSYYAPIPDADFARYADQLPEGFPCCCKAPAMVTSPVLPDRGSREPNPDFLNADRFIAELLEPVERTFREHAGPFILQFPAMLRRAPIQPSAFLEGLDRFLGHLPASFSYAVELRDRALLNDTYAAVLARHGAAHVYNAWTAMPLPGEQAKTLPVESMPFAMVRLLLRPGATYEQQREAFAPFDRLQAPDEALRAETADIVGRAVERAIPAWVLVNNKAEGSAPLTVEELAPEILERIKDRRR